MDSILQRQLIDFLSEFATENRLDTFEQVLASRTRHITVALENIFQPHNASAVLRTVECFGIQDVHIIENDYEYRVNPDIVLGASKWLTMKRYNTKDNNTEAALHHLRSQGYRIVATTPHTDDVPLELFDPAIEGPSALFFGTEMEGLSEVVLDQADAFLRIPICGFTESFNISVSAAIILHQLTRRLRESDIAWQLTESEKNELRLEWLKKSVKHSNLLIQRFLNTSVES